MHSHSHHSAKEGTGIAPTTKTPSLQYYNPELARRWNALAGPLRRYLLEHPGIIGAWITADALEDTPTQTEQAPLVLALVEDGFEGSEAIGNDTALVISRMNLASLLDAIQDEEDLREVIARGYRLCGVDREVCELEQTARGISH